MPNKKIFIMVGEPSGDKLGSLLAKALKKIDPELNLSGVGSNNMKDARVKLLLNSDKLAVTGLFEILKNIRTIKHTLKTVMENLAFDLPDLLILVDYPGFNLRLAKRAKALGLRVMYYVSPQIWAWHYSRIKKIRRYVDFMAVLYPFEKELYQKANIPVAYVGHPLLTETRATESKSAAYQTFSLNPRAQTVGLLPGSRMNEIKRLLPEMLTATRRIAEHNPNTQFVLLLASNLAKDVLNGYDLNGIKVIHNDLYNALQLCDAVITTSGTVTLEVALMQIPQVIIYKLNKLTYWVGKAITNIKQFGLCNIVAEDAIAVELLQNKANAANISREIIKILDNALYRSHIQEKMHQLKQTIVVKEAAKKAALSALALIQTQQPIQSNKIKT